VRDLARSKAFYGAAFGRAFTDYGPGYTAFSDGRLDEDFTTDLPPRPGGPLVILFADDLEATLQRVEQAGAQILKPISTFPGGRRFHFEDPDGYELAVWSDQGAELADRPRTGRLRTRGGGPRTPGRPGRWSDGCIG
jgi:uncharacterized protein